MALPDREKVLEGLRKAGLISETATPEGALLDEMSSRMTQGMDTANAMRTDLYLMDVVNVAKKGSGSDEDLLQAVKQGQGFRTANMVFEISDETTSKLLSEAKEKLSA